MKVVKMKHNETVGASIHARPRRTQKNPSLLKSGPVIWAVDPFEQNRQGRTEIIKALRMFKEKSESVLPVSVVSPIELNWPVDFFPDMQTQIFNAAKKSLSLLKAEVGDMGSPAVLVAPQASHRRAAEKLVDYAKAERAKLIVLNTSSRHGFERLRVGSFAEAVIGVSPIPVLVMGPRSQSSARIRKIFVPTDYSDESHRLFKKAIMYAKQNQARVYLFHVRSMPPHLLNVDPQFVDSIWKQQGEMVTAKSARWRKEAEKNQVSCQVMMDLTDFADLGSRLVQGIQSCKPDLVVMGVKCTPNEQLLFGGNTRYLLAQASCPVLVVRSK